MYIQSKIILTFFTCIFFLSCKKKKPTIDPTPVPIQVVKDTVTAPQHLCIYYGYPSLVNGATTIAQAVTQFKQFDIIVLGDSIWVPTHPDRLKTKQIIDSVKAQKPSIQIFGYVDLGVTGGAWIHNLTNAQLTQAIDGWKLIGVSGIFGDDFGFDYGVTRNRQNTFIDYAHGQGLTVFANSWRVNDALGGSDCHLNANDYYLLESLLYSNGAYQNLDNFKLRSDSVKAYQRQNKIKVAVVGTTIANGNNPALEFSNQYYQTWYATAMYNFNACQFTDFWHSAGNNKVYYFADPITNYGTKWQSDDVIKISATKYSRSTELNKLNIEGDGVSNGRGFVGP